MGQGGGYTGRYALVKAVTLQPRKVFIVVVILCLPMNGTTYKKSCTMGLVLAGGKENVICRNKLDRHNRHAHRPAACDHRPGHPDSFPLYVRARKADVERNQGREERGGINLANYPLAMFGFCPKYDVKGGEN